MGRALTLAFGVVAYAAFGAAFVLLASFVADIDTARGIDHGLTASRGTAIAVDLALVALFGVSHSVMARPAFKAWWTRIVPEAVERSVYVLVTSAVFGLLIWQWRAIPERVWEVDAPAARHVLHGISIAGVALLVYATFLTDHFDLFGLRQVWFAFRGTPYTPVPFREHSLYRFMRHPMMVGVALWMWAAPTMSWGRLVFCVAMTAYIVIGVWFEERGLARTLGAPYEAYRARVRAFLPFRRGSVS